MRRFGGLLHAKLITLPAKTRYAQGHVDCFILTCSRARARSAIHPANGGVACGLRERSEGQSVAGDRVCRCPCGSVDPDPGQSQGGAGRSHGCRGSLRLGPEIPVRLWQASAARRVGRGRLVQDFPGRQLGHLRAGDGNTRLRHRDLLVDRGARGRSPPRLLRRGDARALPDLQFQGLQIQSGSAAAGNAAAGGAGFSACLRKALVAIRLVAWPRRRAGADDKILGADHDRRRRDRGADPSRPVKVPALAGAVVAIATLIVAMIPHLVWLKEVHFVPLTYAGDTYGLSSRAQTVQLVLGYIVHNLALLAVPVALAAAALAWSPRWWMTLARQPLALFTRAWSRGENTSVNASQALNIWIIQIVVAVGPPLGGLIFTVYMKTDWGISLFFLTPLALVAIPSLRLQKTALFHITAIWLAITLAVLAASPTIAAREIAENPNGASGYGARSELARELTEAWQTRFHTKWAVVAGTTEIGEPMTFYSPDHPAPFTPGEVWSSGLTSLEEAGRLGFIGICDTSDPRLPVCDAWMAANAGNAERLAITTQRFFHGNPGPAISWKVYLVPPAN